MSKAFLEEVDELIRARYPMIYVVTWEEDRVRQLLAQIAAKQRKALFEWSVAPRACGGVLRRSGSMQPPHTHCLAVHGRLISRTTALRSGIILLSTRCRVGTDARAGAPTSENMRSEAIRTDADFRKGKPSQTMEQGIRRTARSVGAGPR